MAPLIPSNWTLPRNVFSSVPFTALIVKCIPTSNDFFCHNVLAMLLSPKMLTNVNTPFILNRTSR
ncbi:hypothetical protein KVMX100_80238 [Klebsiella variicola]|nr:hypothetical protein KVMX100_80238 [Klebsiella variicola]